MADYRVISDSEVDPDAPVTSELAYAFRDNPIAIAEGATGSPTISGAMIRVQAGVMVGAYIFGTLGDSTTGSGRGPANFGQIYPGSELRPAAAVRASEVPATTNGSYEAGRRSDALSGSWRCCGHASPSAQGGGTSAPFAATLFQRVA